MSKRRKNGYEEMGLQGAARAAITHLEAGSPKKALPAVLEAGMMAGRLYNKGMSRRSEDLLNKMVSLF